MTEQSGREEAKDVETVLKTRGATGRSRAWRRLAVIAGATVLYLALVILGGATGWPPFTGSTSANTCTSSICVKFPPPMFQLDVGVIPPSQSSSGFLELQARSLTYYANEAESVIADELCLDRVAVLNDLFHHGSGYWGGFFQGELPLCMKLDTPGLTLSTEQGNTYRSYTLGLNSLLSTAHLAKPSRFWYPFDGLATHASLLLEYRLRNNGEVIQADEISPHVVGWAEGDLDWDIALAYTEGLTLETPLPFGLAGWEVNEIESFSELGINLSRPITYRIIYPVVLAALFLLTGALSFARSLDTLVEGSLAILLGILGLKEVLVPTQVAQRTILDLAILCLYFLLAVSLLQGLVMIVRESRRADGEHDA